jgi:hypothetical protein
MDAAAPSFLDAPALLERSMPRRRRLWLWYVGLAGAVMILTTIVTAEESPQLQALVRFLGGLAMFAMVLAMGWFTSHTLRQQRREQQRVEAIEELVQLRRWDHAAAMIEALLSRPTLTMGARLQALFYLASVLARYDRFADAITVQEYLLNHAEFDPITSHGLKLMRTMALLHEDHLVDADRAMGELRREAPDSAGLALIEIYRDVKTGHPAEAIEVFRARAGALRGQLGHRIADAYALVARAYDLLEQPAEAAAAFENATLLTCVDELFRRYPEVAALRGKYPGATAPREVAQ